MLEREQVFDPELVLALSRHSPGGQPSPYPQRGSHPSRMRGASIEFSEHTEYTPGDDLKHLDWKLYAKTDRYYVRRFEDERLSRTVLVLDASNSMSYGGGAVEGGVNPLVGSKYQLAAKVCVAIAACLIRQGDAVGLYVASEAPYYIAPRAGGSQLEALIDVIGRTPPAGHADLAAAYRDAAGRLGSQSTIVAVSDLLDEEVEGLGFLAGLRARSIESRLVQILHHDETGLPFDRMLRFLDLESDAKLVLDPEAVREAYIEEIRAHVQALGRDAHEAGAGFALVRDTEEAAAKLGPLLRSSERGAG